MTSIACGVNKTCVFSAWWNDGLIRVLKRPLLTCKWAPAKIELTSETGESGLLAPWPPPGSLAACPPPWPPPPCPWTPAPPPPGPPLPTSNSPCTIRRRHSSLQPPTPSPTLRPRIAAPASCRRAGRRAANKVLRPIFSLVILAATQQKWL